MEPESKPVVSKVELPLKKCVIKIEVGETSQGRDQLVISIDQEAQKQSGLSREERFKMFEEENKVPTSTTPKIQKVIFLLRGHKDFVKYYEPRVVSLGPIHHGKEKYQLAEEFKLRLAKLFVNSSGKNIKELWEAVDEKIKELRECFEEEVTNKFTDDDLAWILVVDGCAILQYIDLAIQEKFEELDIKPDSVAFCQQDLFLLENQVPYYLLQLLMGLSNMGDNLKNSVERFIERNHNMVLMDKRQQRKGENSAATEDPQSGKQPGNGKKPTHLLDLLRSSLLGAERPIENASKTGKTEGNQPSIQKVKRPCPRAPAWLTSNLIDKTSSILSSFFKLCSSTRNKSSEKPENNPDWQSYRNVQELKAAGIHVKRSEVNSLRGISFSKRLNFYPGFLSLPPLIVDDSTAPKFLNLIAYEMCLDFKNDFGITSYVSFLDSLIDEANDVKELRKAHVLFNLLGSDEEVAEVFNEIGTDLVPDLREYKNVRTEIQKYYSKTWVPWVAEFFHDHFSSPWTIGAFVGALLALALTATQTWYAVDSPASPCDKFCDKFNQNLRKG